MNRRLFPLVGLSLILALLPAAGLSGGTTPVAQALAMSAVSSSLQPASWPRSEAWAFIENAGQWEGDSRFQVFGGSAAVWLSEDAIWLTVVASPAEGAPSQPNPHRAVAVRLSFANANPHVRLESFGRLDTTVSYFLGANPATWRPDVPVWSGVRYVDLYPGVDLELTVETGQLIPRLIAQPGTDLSAVRLHIEGVEAVRLDGGILRLSTAAGEASWPLLRTAETGAEVIVRAGGAQQFDISAPFAGGDTLVAAGHSLSSDNNPYDLLYSTFLGGTYYDQGYGIALDGSGAAYVVGKTSSSDFPTTPGAFDESENSWDDVFVVKLSADDSALEYATFLGGSGGDIGWGIAVDGSGAAYVTGSTKSSDWPATLSAFDTSLNGYQDAFVAKLSPAGSALEYATYLGGSSGYGSSGSSGIAVDESGAAYVTGSTSCPDFPTTPGAFDTIFHGTGNYADAFVVKLSAAGSDLDYSTFLGGNADDTGMGIAVRSSLAYVTGYTMSPDFPATPGAFDISLSGDGGQDAFVAGLNATGSALGYATFLGGNGGDCGNAITVDDNNAAYVTGYGSSEFPITPGAFDATSNGSGDVFVAKVHADGSALDYGTFLGGSELDQGYDIALDGSGAAYVTGLTRSFDLPVTADAFDSSYGGYGSDDCFVAKLDTVGSVLAYATYLGSAMDEAGWSIAVDGSKAAYVTGYADSVGFPVTPDAFDTNWNGYLDAFVAKLAMGVRTSFWISGRVVDGSGLGISGVTVSAGSVASATTGANGDYVINHVITGTYTLTPTKLCHSFSPPTRSVTVPPDAVGQDFAGTPPLQGTYSISGRVTGNDDLGTPDVTIDARVGYTHTTTMTDANGDYVICGLPSHLWGYQLTTSKLGYSFLPSSRWLQLPPDAVGQDFASHVDIGFRPIPDGYSFVNGPNGDPEWGIYPSTVLYNNADQIRMFGWDAVCWMVGASCQIKPTALAWQQSVNTALNFGHCVGMSATSLRFFRELDDPGDFQPLASNAYELHFDLIRGHIQYYNVVMFARPVANHFMGLPSDGALSRLALYMMHGAPDPLILALRPNDVPGNWGHAVTPYAVEYRGGTVWWVWVYDNNWPGDADRHVVYDTSIAWGGTWWYEFWPGFVGSNSGSTTQVIPISYFDQQPECPFCSPARALSEAALGQVWLTGMGHLLITDAQGRRIGYDGTDFVSEVPGAYETSVLWGPGNAVEPIYTLPLTQTYSILLDGQTLTQTESVDVTQFGPGYAASAEEVALQPGSQDSIVIANDGAGLGYGADSDREATLTLALDGDTESYRFQVVAADIGAGQVVTLSADTAQQRLAYSNAQAGGGAYDLRLTRVSDAGTWQFLHRAIAIQATDTHYVDYGGWGGLGPVTLSIDRGSDGDIDETLMLGNQISLVYLPLNLRNP